jgi:hypothetical protein
MQSGAWLCCVCLLTLFLFKIESCKKREIGEHIGNILGTYWEHIGNMFATLFALQIDNIDLVRTLHSFHLIQSAIHKEECNGFHMLDC